MTNILLPLLLLLATATAQAQTPAPDRFNEADMYDCYLSQNKQLWKEYVNTADWQQMSNSERQRLLNYEYGYIAYAISCKEKNVERMLNNYLRHLAEMEGQMPESTRLTYLAAAFSYTISVNKITIWSNGPKTFSYSEKAVQTDPDNPYALTLRGSIFFYCPKTFGGDKSKALDFVQRAENRFRQTGDTVNNWNYRSAQMIIAQCYEKTGDKEAAIRKCREILQEEPRFSYIRDCYLPELLGEKPHDDTNPQNMGASFVSSFE